MGRILVIRGGAIGDFILTLPALAALRAQFPQAGVDVLGYPHIARLSLMGGLADAAHPIEARGLARFFARGGPLDEPTARFFGEYALIVSYLYDPDAIFRVNVAACTGAQFIAGPHRPDDRGVEHACDCFLRPLQSLAIFDADGVPRLKAESERPGPGRWIAAHPGSGSDAKNWPERRWAELLRRTTAETPFKVLLVGGEAEGDRLDRLASGLPADRVQLARSVPLDRLARLLKGCALFIGHDSGISHLASAVGLSTLVLWGPTNPAVWRPRGEGVLLLQDDAGIAGLGTETVWGVLSRRLAHLDPEVSAPAADGT